MGKDLSPLYFIVFAISESFIILSNKSTHSIVFIMKTKKGEHIMKKIRTISLLTTAGLALAGCSLAGIDLGGSEENIDSLVTTKTMAFQATTGLSLVKDLGNTIAVSTMSDQEVITSEVEEETSEEEVDEVTETSDITSEEDIETSDSDDDDDSQAEVSVEEPDIPVATLDLLFTNGLDFSVDHQVSDREGYTNLDVIAFNVLGETEVSYSLYYNVETLEEDDELTSEEIIEEELTDESSLDGEENINSETPETTEETGEETEEDSEEQVNISLEKRHGNGQDDQDDDDDEDEEDYGNGHQNGDHDGEGNGEQNQNREQEREQNKDELKITGLAVVGDEEYRFMSKTEIDEDSDEKEIEMKFMLFKDEMNFISIKQEIETEGVEGTADYEYEEEFKYMVVEKGQRTRQFKLEIEQEDGEQELEVKIDGVKYEVSYQMIDGRTFIHIDTNGRGEFVYEKIIVTDELTGETSLDYILQ